MRVSSSQFYTDNLRYVQQNSTELAKLSVQMATKDRIQRPSDDPLGAVMLLTLNSELQTLEQYGANMNAVNFNLGQQETQLSGIVNTLFSLQELVTTAADGSVGETELRALGQEMSVLFPAILDFLNAKDGTGRYYFSGSLTDTMPFVQDAAGVFSYQGDAMVRQVKVSDTSNMASNIVGSALDPGAGFLNQMQSYLDLINTNPAAGVGDESRLMIDNISNFLANVSGEITRIGGIRASLDELAIANSEIGLFTEELKDEVKTINDAEVFIRLNQVTASYESSLKVYANLSKLSLFSML